MKKLLVACLTVFMMMLMLSGCGETATPSTEDQNDSTKPTSPVEDFSYEENEDGTITISWYNGEDAHVVIPDTIDGKTVTAIRDYTFMGKKFLVSVEIPDTVTVVGIGCFASCSALKSVTLSENLVEIGGGAFDSCTSLVSIQLPNSLEKIGYGAFMGCSNLESADVPDSVKEMGEDVFGGTKIAQSTLGSSQDFDYMENEDGTLTILYYKGANNDVVIPQTIDGKTVTKIDLLAFFGDLSLSLIEIPDTVTALEAGTFKKCSNLEKVVLPKSLTERN